jgi:hypothetical protein
VKQGASGCKAGIHEIHQGFGGSWSNVGKILAIHDLYVCFFFYGDWRISGSGGKARRFVLIVLTLLVPMYTLEISFCALLIWFGMGLSRLCYVHPLCWAAIFMVGTPSRQGLAARWQLHWPCGTKMENSCNVNKGLNDVHISVVVY